MSLVVGCLWSDPLFYVCFCHKIIVHILGLMLSYCCLTLSILFLFSINLNLPINPLSPAIFNTNPIIVLFFIWFWLWVLSFSCTQLYEAIKLKTLNWCHKIRNCVLDVSGIWTLKGNPKNFMCNSCQNMVWHIGVTSNCLSRYLWRIILQV